MHLSGLLTSDFIPRPIPGSNNQALTFILLFSIGVPVRVVKTLSRFLRRKNPARFNRPMRPWSRRGHHTISPLVPHEEHSGRLLVRKQRHEPKDAHCARPFSLPMTKIVGNENRTGHCLYRRNNTVNAPGGRSTLPIRFIRFFPAFCLSRSLRLRVTSPP